MNMHEINRTCILCDFIVALSNSLNGVYNSCTFNYTHYDLVTGVGRSRAAFDVDHVCTPVTKCQIVDD